MSRAQSASFVATPASSNRSANDRKNFVKISRLLPSLAICSLALSAFAGSGAEAFNNNSSSTATESAGGRFPFEFDAQFSLSGGGELARGFREVRDLDEDYLLTRFIYTPRVKLGILRLGAAYERFGFNTPENFEVPRALQSLSAIVGLDTQFSDSILVRFEAQPGFYSGTRFRGGDFHLPFIFGGTYIYSPDLQFVLGASVDYEREYPVFPGGGIRWRLSSQWVLNAVLPTPRLEYQATSDFTLYAGADLKGSTFRVSDRFGSDRGNNRLNHAVVTYSEVRTGLGLEWKISQGVKVSVEGGYLPYRNLDYHRTDVRYHQERGGAYGSVAIGVAF